MFGMIRSCCGSHDNPDPFHFITVFRLLSFYSLVKPPKGSNVQGIEIFESLLNTEDVEMNENKKEWEDVLQQIIQRGPNNPVQHGVRHHHDYNVQGVNKYAQAYFAGFVAYKINKWTKCSECIESIQKTEGDTQTEMKIDFLNRGYLKYPSNELMKLLSTLESCILQTVGQEPLNFYTFQHVAKNILAESTNFVGCSIHEEQLTMKLINFYVVSRAKILCKTHNKAYNESSKKEKELRKLSKLVHDKDQVNKKVLTVSSESKKKGDTNMKEEGRKRKSASKENVPSKRHFTG